MTNVSGALAPMRILIVPDFFKGSTEGRSG